VVLPNDEFVLRVAILATGILFGYAFFELMHRILLAHKPRAEHEEERERDLFPAEVKDNLDRWEAAVCDEFGIMKFASRREFEEHCRLPHRHRNHHKKKRELEWKIDNSDQKSGQSQG
jgi:hypothetical protein